MIQRENHGGIYIVHDLSERKVAEDKLGRSEQRIKMKLEKILSPARKIENLVLADIIDVQVIQSLMNDFYKLAHMPIGINDLKGNVLVSAGWQDICTKFHRVHPRSLQVLRRKRYKTIIWLLPLENLRCTSARTICGT